jgi:hypothetical protein
MLLIAGGLLAGCSGSEQSPRFRSGPPRPGQFPVVKRSIDQIGKDSYGSAYRSAQVQSQTAAFTFAISQNQQPQQNFNRLLLIGSDVIGPAFGNDMKTQTVRITAVDPNQPGRRLLVFSYPRAANDDPKNPRHIDWQHAKAANLKQAVTIEYIDPALQSFASGQGR